MDESLKASHEQKTYIKTKNSDVEVNSEPEDVDSDDDVRIQHSFADTDFMLKINSLTSCPLTLDVVIKKLLHLCSQVKFQRKRLPYLRQDPFPFSPTDSGLEVMVRCEKKGEVRRKYLKKWMKKNLLKRVVELGH